MNITKKNLKSLKNGEKVNLVVDIEDNLCAAVTLAPHTNGSVKVKVTLKTKNPNKTVTIIRPIQRTIKNIDALDATLGSLTRKLVADYKGLNSRAKKNPGSSSKKSFKELVESVPGIRDPKSYGIRRSTGKILEQSSVNMYVNYYIHTIGAMYNRYGSRNVPEEKQLQYKAELIDQIDERKDGHAKGSRTKDKIARDVNVRWAAAEEIRRYCEKTIPLIDWGNELAVSISSKGYENEMLKVIPYEKLIMAAAVIVTACKRGVPEAFASCGEVFCGCRVGESCALQIGKFEMKNDTGRYYVDTQINNDGKLTGVLKNEYSYRYIIVHGVLKDMYDLRYRQLIDYGYTEDEIKEAFLGSTNDDPFKPVRKDKVSAFLKAVLLAVGCDRKEIKLIEAAVEGDEGHDSDHDLCAHLFRKIFATLTANGGIKVNEIDALLGHENKLNKKEDYASWDFVERMAAMLDRAIYFGRLTATTNPAYCPVEIANDSILMKGNKRIQLIAVADGILKGCVQSIECNDSMDITITQIMENAPIVMCNTDTETDKHNRDILPFLPDEEIIESCIKKAGEIDIDKLIKRRTK